jgi:hypothetical protein
MNDGLDVGADLDERNCRGADVFPGLPARLVLQRIDSGERNAILDEELLDQNAGRSAGYVK